MEKVILYEHGCPKCKVLKMKLDAKGIQYEDISDVEVMKDLGFMEAPKLVVGDTVMGFSDAVEWVKEQ